MKEETLRRKVETRIKKKLTDEEWEYLKYRGYVDDALIEDDPEFLVGVIRDLQDSPFGRSHRERSPRGKGKKLTLKLRDYSDPHSKAYHELISLLAYFDPEIEDFRQRILDNKLLTPEEVLPWAMEMLCDDRIFLNEYPIDELSFWTTEAQWEQENERFKDRQQEMNPNEWRPRYTLLKRQWEIENECSGADFQELKHSSGYGWGLGGEGWRPGYIRRKEKERIVVSLYFPHFGGEYSWPLAWLKHIANRYRGFWFEPDTVQFVLTGQKPSGIRFEEYAFIPRFGVPYIHLEVPWCISPEKVAEIFRELQALCAPRKKLKRFSEKHLNLALYFFASTTDWEYKGNYRYLVFTKPTGEEWKSLVGRDIVIARKRQESWRELMEEWNVTYPEWKYESVRNFQRDVKRSLEQVDIAPTTLHFRTFNEYITTLLEYHLTQWQIEHGDKEPLIPKHEPLTGKERSRSRKEKKEGESDEPAGQS